MTDQTIRQALTDHLYDLGQDWDIAAFEKPYSPTTGTPYIREDFLPAQTFQADLGTSGRNRHQGIYQLTLVYPPEGPFAADNKQTELLAHFKRGTRIEYGGIVVVIEPPWPGPKQAEADWIRRPLNIPYFSYLNNPA